jgi:hypothetical protein
MSSLVSRRIDGTFEIDPWGLDVDLLDAVQPLARLRWKISVEGTLPDGPALLHAPRRLLSPAAESFVIAVAVLRETGRPLRVLGIPDVAPIGSLLRKLGGAVEHPAEAAALLRAGHLVLSRHDFEVDAPVVRVRTRGWEPGRRWHIDFG